MAHSALCVSRTCAPKSLCAAQRTDAHMGEQQKKEMQTQQKLEF